VPDESLLYFVDHDRPREPTVPIASLTIQEELGEIVAFLGVIWGVFVVSRVVPRLDCYGVVPRTWRGLAGIPAMPFIHKDLHHILGNTIPLFILLALLDGSSAKPWQVVVELVLLGGFLLWLVGRPGVHIGASGLVFALIAFLIVSGFLEKRLVSLAVAVIVGFVYGGTLISGVLPRFKSYISWDGHLCSAVAGAMVAYALWQW
jgi:membrane associated rhomboid family serine protease